MKIVTSNQVEVHTTAPSQGKPKDRLWVEPNDFCAISQGKRRKRAGPYLILGFDTEYKTPGYAMSRDDIKDGKAKFRVLSYQFHAKTSEGLEWSGICCPEGDDRMSIGDFIVFALAVGAREHGANNLPRTIYLVGHFTRADIPAFADFRDNFAYFSSVRSTIVTVDTSLPVSIAFENGTVVPLEIRIRDTLLLSPQATKSLAQIGELVGVPKLSLHPEKAEHQRRIENMDEVRDQDWELFKKYALNDALICVRYMDRIIAQYQAVTGKIKVPITLTSIGVDLLLKSWREDLKLDPLEILGKEEVKQKFFDRRRNYFRKVKRVVDLEPVDTYNKFGIESYHGGRNEQFWFGPCFEDHWTDYDLSSAYPTAMSLIGKPVWEELRPSLNQDDFTHDTLGYALVEFKFPEHIRYPTMPVRTDNGLIFPLSGTTFCPSPEIAVAQALGADIKIIRGIIVPTDSSIPIFGEFIKKCLEYRKEAGPKTLAGLFWKEISNSTYGKTAQGLREKRVYDMRLKDTAPLPLSRITNPFFAAYITSYVRAVLGEIMNSLTDPTMVFSCTTDGFITNARGQEMERAQQGPLTKRFALARQELTGDPRVLEIKHEIRQPLGWRTRGQATLKTGALAANDGSYSTGESQSIVLAKGGIFTPVKYENDEQENQYITNLFFERDPYTEMRVNVRTGIRDIAENDADLVDKLIVRRLSMEFDWKQRPKGLGYSAEFGHVLFSTEPWQTVVQFQTIREAWDDYTRKTRACIKTLADFDHFASFVETTAALPREVARYMRRERGDLKRLRQMLCAAWHDSEAGFSQSDRMVSASKFAEMLTSFGIPCKKEDVENGKKRVFKPKFIPATDAVKLALDNLKTRYPSLEVDEFLCIDTRSDAISIRPTRVHCLYVVRCNPALLPLGSLAEAA